MSKNLLILLSFVSCTACVSNHRSLATTKQFRALNLNIPAIEFPVHTKVGLFDVAQSLGNIVNDSRQSNAVDQLIAKKTSLLPPLQQLLCGGVLMGHRQPKLATLDFDIIAVTETWVPINNQVTRVLHLRFDD